MILTPERRAAIREQIAVGQRAWLQALTPAVGMVPLYVKSLHQQQSQSLEIALELLLRSDKQVLLLVGESGSGKSTYTQQWVRRFHESIDPQVPLAVWVPLLHWRGQSRWSLETVLREYGLAAEDIDALKAERVPIHWVLDGYDEWGQWQNLYVQQGLSDWSGKVIITCCQTALSDQPQYPQFFMPYRGSQRQIQAYQELWLQPFSAQQIDDYLSRVVMQPECPWPTVAQYRAQIARVPGLETLMTTPLSLQLVVSALPNLIAGSPSSAESESLVSPLTQAALLDAFLEAWCMRQAKKFGAKSEWPALQRRLLAHATHVASCFARADVMQIDYQHAKESSDLFDDEDEIPAERLTVDSVDWASCFGPTVTPLWQQLGLVTCESHRYYRFQHPLLQHYLGTRDVYTPPSVKEEKNLAPARKPVPSEPGMWVHHPLNQAILDASKIGLLADRVKTDPEFADSLWSMVEASRQQPAAAAVAANAITILNAARIPLSGRLLSGIRIPRAHLSGAVCDATDFSGSDLRGVRWQNAYLRDANFARSQWQDTDLGEEAYWAGHRAGIRTCAVTRTAHPVRIVSGSQDNSWIMWEADTGQPLERRYAHAAAVSHVAVHPDGTEVISAGQDGLVKQWVESRNTFHSYWQTAQEPIQAMAVDFSRSFIFINADGKLLALDYHPRRVEGGEPSLTTAVSLVPQWQRSDDTLARTTQTLLVDETAGLLFAGQSQGQVTLLQGLTGESIQTWSLAREPILCLALSANGHWLAAGTAAGVIILWDTRQGLALHHLPAHQGPVHTVAFHPTATTLSLMLVASGGADGVVRLWSCAEGSRLNQWTAHREAVTSVVFLPAGDRLISCSADRTIRVWPLTQYPRPAEEGGSAPIVQLLSVPHQPLVVVIDQGGHGAVWHADTGQRWRQWPTPFPGVRNVVSRPEGSALRMALLDAVTGQHRALEADGLEQDLSTTVLLSQSMHTVAQFSPDGRWLLVGDTWGRLQVLRAQGETGAWALPPIPAHAMGVTAILWPSPTRVISADARGALMGWDWRDPSPNTPAESPQLRLRWTTNPQLTASGADFETTEQLTPSQVQLLGQRGGESPEMIQIGLRAALLIHDAAQVARCLTRYPDLLQTPLDEQKTPWQIACQYSPWPVIQACLITHGFSRDAARHSILSESMAQDPGNPLALALGDNVWGAIYELCQALDLRLEELKALSWQSLRRQVPELTRALAQASTRWDGGEVVELLLVLGVDPDFPTADGLTPLMQAARTGCEPGARLLLEYGASKEETDPLGNTALLHAATQGQTAFLRWFLDEAGAQAAAVNRAGEDALVRAARFNQADTVQALLAPEVGYPYDAHRAIQTVLHQGKSQQRYQAQTVVAVALLASTLSVLDLRSSDMGPEGAHLLAQGLAHNATLVQVDVHNSSFQARGGLHMAEILSTMSRLERLNIRSNYLGDVAAEAILTALETRSALAPPLPAITLLDIRDNAVSDACLQRLRDGAERLGIPEYYDLYNDPEEEAAAAFALRIPTKETAASLLLQTGMYQPRKRTGRGSLIHPEGSEGTGHCHPTFGHSNPKPKMH